MNLQTRRNSSVQKSKNGQGLRNRSPRTKIIGESKNHSKDDKVELSNCVNSNQQLLFSESEMELLIVKKQSDQDEFYGGIII